MRFSGQVSVLVYHQEQFNIKAESAHKREHTLAHTHQYTLAHSQLQLERRVTRNPLMAQRALQSMQQQCENRAQRSPPPPPPHEGFHVCRARVDNVKHEAGSGRRTADSGWRHQQRSMDIINLDPFPHLGIFFRPVLFGRRPQLGGNLLLFAGGSCWLLFCASVTFACNQKLIKC